MASGDLAVQDVAQRSERDRIINDFSIQVATVNGSGSQSANTVLLRSLFRMGVPVSGKNLFPSNIAGLPTWYTIRCSKHGYVARKKEIDMLVAMNPETAKEDVMSLASGASVIYDEPLKLDTLRSDLIFYSVPYDKIGQAAQAGQEHDLCLRCRADARIRDEAGGSGAAQAVCQESKSRRLEYDRREGRF